jgi:U3 small nucleolar RNA-associated protein 4
LVCQNGQVRLSFVVNSSENVIVSGDSNGKTQFWDAKIGTLIRAFQSHEADILTIAVSKNQTVFSAGVDHKIVQFRFVSSKRVSDETELASQINSTLNKWIMVGKQRYHTHDIRSLEFVDNEKYLVSGGVDCQLKLLESPFDFENCSVKRTITPYPSESFMKQNDGLITVGNMNNLKIWKLDEVRDAHTTPSEKLLVDLTIDSERYMTCFDISKDNSIIAVGTDEELKLFSYVEKRIRQIENDIGPCHAVKFSMDRSKLVVATNDSKLYVYGISSDYETEELAQFQLPEYAVHSLNISEDDQWLACGTLNNEILIINLDTLKVLKEFKPDFRFTRKLHCSSQNTQSVLFIQVVLCCLLLFVTILFTFTM